jgi:hypothetical protein
LPSTQYFVHGFYNHLGWLTFVPLVAHHQPCSLIYLPRCKPNNLFAPVIVQACAGCQMPIVSFPLPTIDAHCQGTPKTTQS